MSKKRDKRANPKYPRISTEDREDIVAEIKYRESQGASRSEAVAGLAHRASSSTLRRWLALAEQTGDVAPKKRLRKLDDMASELLWTWLTNNNQLTIEKMQQLLQKEGYDVCQTGIRRCLKKIGIICRRYTHPKRYIWQKNDAVCKFVLKYLERDRQISLHDLHRSFMRKSAVDGFDLPLSLFSRRLSEVGIIFQDGKWGVPAKPGKEPKIDDDRFDHEYMEDFYQHQYGLGE